jgi:heme-binding NEAT domain protein
MSSFSHAGVSRHNGEFKVRFANDALRVKVLAKNGHKDIDIVELKVPMSKEDAVAYLLKIDFDNGNKEVRAALEAAQEKRSETPKAGNKDAPKKEVKKPKKAPKTTPSLDAIKARAKVAAPKAKVTKAEVEKQLADLENAPF